MIDIQYIRDNSDVVKQKSEQKGYSVDIDKLIQLDAQRSELLQQVEEIRKRRNENAEKMKGGQPEQALIDEGKQIKIELAEREEYLDSVQNEWLGILKQVPNMPLDDVPVGTSEDENVVVKTVGEPTKFDFQPKSHAEIAEAKGWLDKERAAKVTGSRFTYIKGDLVKLQFAIIQFILDKLTDQDFIRQVISENNLQVSDKTFVPVLPPFMIRTELYDAMDRLEPQDDRYKIENEDLWLQGSAEHVLGSMHANEILTAPELPVRYIGYASSFRREAGTYGKDMEGMFRMHQFDKLEMESLDVGENGLQEHLFFVALQEKIMNLLGIPYQVLNKCTADIGKPNARGVDINAWMPGQQSYRETHTADYMTDYQARRLKTRFRKSDGTIGLIHTNDATALPLSRGPIAIIENYQTSEGNVIVPEVLRPYMGGKEKI
ncbi:MAG: serine--tRNA ligase [Candidatus Saccharimonadales bacterium]